MFFTSINYILSFFPPTWAVSNKFSKLQFKKISIYETDCFHADNLRELLKISKRSVCCQKAEQIREILSQLVLKENIGEVDFDLKKLTNVIASKSLNEKDNPITMYHFGENIFHDKDIKKNTSYQSIENCINHISNSRSDYVFNIHYIAWENRYEWHNNGGSHHCAVAVFHANSLQKEYLIKAELTIEKIDLNIANSINEKYKIFILNYETPYDFYNCFPSRDQYIFLESASKILIFDKKNIKKNRKLISLLEAYDQQYILDFNRYLDSLIKASMNNCSHSV